MPATVVRESPSHRVANVVVVPTGKLGDELVRRAGQWVGAGLIDPVLWVRPADVTEHPALPARIDAVIAGRDEEGELEYRTISLFHTLGLEPADEIVVASVRWPVASDAEQQRTADAARMTLSLVGASRPLPGPDAPETRLRSLNILVAPTLMSSSAIEELIDPEWAQNVVVAPEDRPRPQAADRFVDTVDQDGWISFALASVATLAGLWTGHVGSPLPPDSGSGSSGPRHSVHVARTFSRIVITDDYMDELAHAAARALASPVIPETVGGVRVLPAVDAELVVAQATADLLQADSAALRYQKVEPFGGPQERRVGMWNGLVSFLRFSVEKIVAIPFWTWGWVADRLGRGTEASIYGKESGIVVDARRDLGLQDAPRELLDVHDAMAAASAKVKSVIDHPRYAGPRLQQTQIWEIMRKTVFALVDGGPSQSRTLGREIGGVVPDVGMVIPAPSDTWTLPPQVAHHLGGDASKARVISWTDLAAARDLAEHLNERTQDLQQRVQELQARATTAQAELMAAEREYVEARDRLEDLQVDLEDATQRWQIARESQS